MKSVLIALLILLAPAMLVAQPDTPLKPGKTKAQMRAQARQQISDLHNGALLVRLFTKQPSIAALRKAGNNTLADKMEADQAELNKAIVSAFRTNFDFCPVYFFFSDDSQYVREKHFENVRFLNDSLQTDTSISFSGNQFFTAEFGTVQQDTATYNYYVPGEIGPKRESPSYGGPGNGFGALVIKSDLFIQLRRPFPYYVRTYDSLPFARRRPVTVVDRMNKELHAFLGAD